MNFKKLTPKPPVSRKYKIEIDESRMIAHVDLSDIDDYKVINNSIIDTIIVYHQNKTNTKLTGIKFKYDKDQEKFIAVISRQIQLFDLKLYNTISDLQTFKFDKVWESNIENGMSLQFPEWKRLLKNYKGILFYKTVTENNIQIRFYGYKIAEFNPAKTASFDNIKLDNNKWNCKTFDDIYEKIRTIRLDPNNHKKLEHYLESIILQELNDSLMIKGTKIEKLFDSDLNFQFPTLLHKGEKIKGYNSPKYVDVIAKSGDRPVVMELKFLKGTSNSRGAYIFQAFGQLLNYYVYLKEIFSDNTKKWEGSFAPIGQLDWHNPILYIIVDNLGKDAMADRLRKYVENIQTYIKPKIDLRFIEIDSDIKTKGFTL